MENQNTSPINVSEIMDGIREEIKEKGLQQRHAVLCRCPQ